MTQFQHIFLVSFFLLGSVCGASAQSPYQLDSLLNADQKPNATLYGETAEFHNGMLAINYEDANGDETVDIWTTDGTTWTLQQTVAGQPELQQQINFFYMSDLALSDDFLALAAPTDSTSAGIETGTVHLHPRSGNSIGALQVLEPPMMFSDGDRFGAAIDIYRNWMIVGAPEGDVAVLYNYDGNDWNEVDQINAPTAGVDFGNSVAIGENIVAIQAIDDSIGPNVEGTVTIVPYDQNGFGTSFTAEPNATGRQTGTYGSALDIQGDTVVIGDSDAERVQMLEYATTGLTTRATLSTADTAGDNTRFGQSVAINGDDVVVGAPSSSLQAGGAGAAYLYTAAGGSYTESGFSPAALQQGDNFGFQVFLSDRYLISTARSHTPSSGGSEGTALVFRNPNVDRQAASEALNRIAIGPNPTRGRLQLTNLPEGTVTATVQTIDGRTFSTETLRGRSATLEIDAPAGLYLVELQSDAGQTTRKLVVH